MRVVALTGGIGSGKSEVSRRFAALGVPVIDTDEISRELVEPGSPALSEIATVFGAEILDPDGHLDRRRLRAVVFSDDDRRRRLEDILHPRIRDRALERLSGTDEAPYAMVVVPLLLETRYPIPADRVLVVDAPEALCVKRVAERDGVAEADARRIVERQATRAQRLAAADDLITNDGDLEALDARVEALHRKYLGLAGP